MNAKRKQLRSGQADRAARRCVPFGAGRWPQPPVQRGRLRRASPRRGTVLIMVVALLSILFVVGAAFLSTVTFESRSISSAEKTRVRNCVLDALLGEVRTELRKGFVGADGRPWNSDLDSAIGNDIYGEVPGIHPLIASTDPYHNDPVHNPDLGDLWYFYQVSDLELALADTRLDQAIDPAGTPLPAMNLVAVDLALDEVHPHPDLQLYFDFSPTGWDEKREGNTNLEDLSGSGGQAAELYRRDADGDGVWDSYEHKLPISRYAPAIRGGLAGELRAKDAPPEELDDIYYALRIIPHGAMVNLSHAHDTILRTLLTDVELDTAGPIYLEGPFSPVSEEADLRRRFLLPPLRVPMTDLQERQGQVPRSLYYPFVPGGDLAAFGTGDLDARWWPIDTGTDGDYVLDVTNEWINKWLTEPPDTPMFAGFSPNADFAKRHLLTTISYEDQLMRIGRSSQPGFEHQDWIEDIMRDDAGTDAILPDNFLIDDWPNSNPDDPIRGRLKVSLPGLVQRVLVAQDPLDADPPEDGGWFGPGGSHESNPIDALADPAFDVQLLSQFTGTIQDAFMLMLKNVRDADGDGTPDEVPDDQDARNRLAAALTANLIDFADSDIGGLPTWVEVFDETGNPTGEVAYGLERQPYVTELYSLVDTILPAWSFAIELYNPYGSPIDLTGYRLVDVETATLHDLDPIAQRISDDPATGLDLSPLGITIMPDSFLTIYAGAFDPPVGIQDQQVAVGGNWGVDFNSRIQLVRSVPGPTGSVYIVLDEFDAAATGASDLGKDLIGTTTASVQRDNSLFSPGVSNWRFVVPIGQEVGIHTLGSTNSFVDANIRPVQIDFANTGDVGSAFPTTGSLLLLSRYANTTTAPFNADPVFPLKDNADQIDNGRMPVFHQNQLADSDTEPFDLQLPWGQLVFDYFTALPMAHTYDRTATGPVDMTPTVDQGGLRVHGRVDINAAPWTVLAGMPMLPTGSVPNEPGTLAGLPVAILTKINNFILLDPNAPTPIGPELAQSIVAYREARQMPDTADFSSGPGSGGDRWREDAVGNAYTGFLSVGELANVRRNGGLGGAFDIDSGAISGPPDEDFIEAVAVLVSLGDWVTTRSQVFTIYGTLRGAGPKSAVDRKAIRFQETVDRMPCMFSGDPPKRIGQRIVSGYTDARGD